MRDYIKKKLLSLDLAKIEYYNQDEHFYFIPRYTGPEFSKGTMYLVKFLDKDKYQLPHEYYKMYVSDLSCGKLAVDLSACNPITKEDMAFYWSGIIKMTDIELLAVL